MKLRPRTTVGLLLAGGIALVLLALFVWPGFVGGAGRLASNDPQPPTQGRQGAPERDEVATDLVGRPIYTYAVHALAFSPDSAYLALGAGDGGVMRIELAVLLAHAHDPEVALARRLVAHDNWAFAVTFLDDGSLVTGGGDNLLVRWDADLAKRQTYAQGGHTDDVHALAVSPDEQCLYSTGDDRRLIAWGLDDASVIYDITPHDEQVPALALSPDGAVIATGSRDDRVRLFDAATGDLLHTLPSHDNDVLDLAFSPAGTHLASASYDTTVRIHDVGTGELLHTLRGSKDRVFAVAYSADGAFLAAGGEDGELVVYNTALGFAITKTVSTGEDISRLAFSPDGRWLAGSSSSGSVTLYDVQTFQIVRQLQYQVVEELP